RGIAEAHLAGRDLHVGPRPRHVDLARRGSGAHRLGTFLNDNGHGLFAPRWWGAVLVTTAARGKPLPYGGASLPGVSGFYRHIASSAGITRIRFNGRRAALALSARFLELP